ncbi:MAG: glycosyltransferase family 4 protein, partial [Acidobacteriota bacterium]
MHVLLLAPKAGFFGGVEQHVFDIAGGLVAAGHRCDLAFGQRTGRSDALWRDSFRCFPVKELGADGGGEPLAALVERLRPDVVYGHKVEPIFPTLERLPGRARRLAMIHDHDLVCPRRHKYTAWTGRVCRRPMSMACVLDGAWLRRGERGFTVESMAPKFASLRAATRMDRLVVASRFMEEELVTNGCDPGRIVRLAPVSRRDPASADGSVDGPADGEIDLLFVGQLVRGKGVDLLLRVLPAMTGQARLTLVGDGNARADLEKLAVRLGVRDRTRFVGWVDPERVDGYYRRARVVVMPGRWPEPFGLVGLEAMARAKPVVAFDVGGVRDWLDDGRTGLLV